MLDSPNPIPSKLWITHLSKHSVRHSLSVHRHARRTHHTRRRPMVRLRWPPGFRRGTGGIGTGIPAPARLSPGTRRGRSARRPGRRHGRRNRGRQGRRGRGSGREAHLPARAVREGTVEAIQAIELGRGTPKAGCEDGCLYPNEMIKEWTFMATVATTYRTCRTGRSHRAWLVLGFLCTYLEHTESRGVCQPYWLHGPLCTRAYV
jgi:hypothetical protein